MAVSKILNKEIRVLQRESLGAGISFPRLGRRGLPRKETWQRHDQAQRQLQQIHSQLNINKFIIKITTHKKADTVG